MTIPVARDAVLANLDLGLFYIVAFSVLTVMGLVMAGWGSANKYAILGGLRAAGQLVSYEIPFIMAILAVAMLVQSLDLHKIVDGQATVAHILVQPLGLFIFLLAALAETGRTPFDIHHAESEVVGGPFVEYSGAHWAVFFLAEYMNTFTVAAITVLLFLGGWRWPAMPFDGLLHSSLSAIWFLAKAYMVHSGHLLDKGDLPQIADRPAYGVRLEAFGAPLLHKHHSHRSGPLLRVAQVDSLPDLSGTIGRDLLHHLQAARHENAENDRHSPSRQRRTDCRPGGTGKSRDRMIGFLEGLLVTVKTALRRPVTAQYPDPSKRLDVAYRYMGIPGPYLGLRCRRALLHRVHGLHPRLSDTVHERHDEGQPAL